MFTHGGNINKKDRRKTLLLSGMAMAVTFLNVFGMHYLAPLFRSENFESTFLGRALAIPLFLFGNGLSLFGAMFFLSKTKPYVTVGLVMVAIGTICLFCCFYFG